MSQMRSARKFYILAPLFTILFSACSQPTPQPVTIPLELSDYAFTPATFEVQVGQQVTLEMVNHGALPHELMIGREVVYENDRPNGYRYDLFAETGASPAVMNMEEHQSHIMQDEHGHGSQSFMVTLPEGGHSMTVTFLVTEQMIGEWELGCFEQDGVHYEAGMNGRLVVKP